MTYNSDRILARSGDNCRMDTGDVLLLFDHLYWMRDRVLAAAEAVPQALTSDDPVTIRDLRATLVHELDVQWSWRERLRGDPDGIWQLPDADLKPQNFASLDEIVQHWQRDEGLMREWLAGLTTEELNSRWYLEGPDGHTLFHHLLHIYTHGIQQLSDAAVLLTRAGTSPGELDFGEFIRHRAT